MRVQEFAPRLGAITLMMLSLSGLQTPAISHELDVTALIPLQRIKPYYLDKAKGIGPRFEFGFAPPEVTSPCAKSIKTNVNAADFVGFIGSGWNSEEFRAKASTGLLSPSEAAQLPTHEGYALSGKVGYRPQCAPICSREPGDAGFVPEQSPGAATQSCTILTLLLADMTI
ncbi:MAG: hypothetical protein JO328_12840 [Hyphomicrobiales bacterium]|nr:hypothetical protein [Hyphomicrobiales bacterium]MBV8826423.1 hypothetical protein [Hyphomicrobiales bacterium]